MAALQEAIVIVHLCASALQPRQPGNAGGIGIEGAGVDPQLTTLCSGDEFFPGAIQTGDGFDRKYALDPQAN